MENIAKWCDGLIFVILTLLYILLFVTTKMTHFETFIAFGIYVAAVNTIFNELRNE